MLDLKQNVKALVSFASAILLIWWILAYGIGEPLETAELKGLSLEQVRERYGEPVSTWKDSDGNHVWHYRNGVLPMGAASNVVFEEGAVATVQGHTPNK